MKVLLANPDNLIYLGRVQESTNYDNKPGVRYKLLLRGSLDNGSLVCTKEAYDMAASIDEMTKVNIIGDYSSEYRSFKVSAVHAVK